MTEPPPPSRSTTPALTILVRNLEFIASHGVYAEERDEGRRFQVDLEVDLLDPSSAQSDALSETVDYRGLCELVLQVAHGEGHDLIEWLAAEMTRRILARYDRVGEVRLELRKFATGVPGEPDCVGVRVSARRDA